MTPGPVTEDRIEGASADAPPRPARETAGGLVFDLKKFAVHDGPGIRTVVFLKGCPLSCTWCHNPQSISAAPQMSYDAVRCAACGLCARVCPRGCHIVRDGAHAFDRGRCAVCGACARECPGDALALIGRERTVDGLMLEILKDRRYFEASGGGLTVSGGEPMAQPAFTGALLAAARRAGLHTCLDTCGQATFERYRELMESVDLLHYDIKETDPRRHRDFTGVDGKLILENLFRLDDLGAAIVLRCPVVPGHNDRDEHLRALGRLAGRCRHVARIDILPFHPFGSAEGPKVGRPCALGNLPAADEEQVRQWIETAQADSPVPVKRG